MARKKSITEKADKAPKTLHDPASEEETEDLAPLESQGELTSEQPPPALGDPALDADAPPADDASLPLHEILVDSYAAKVKETIKDPLVANSAIQKEAAAMLTLPLKGSASRAAQAKAAAVDAAALAKALAAAKKKTDKVEKQAAERIQKSELLASAKAYGKVAVVRKRSSLSLLDEPEAQGLLSPQSIASAVRSECQPLLAEVCATAVRQAPPPQIDIGPLLVALVARLQSGQVLGSVLTSNQHIITELERLAAVVEAPAPAPDGLETLAAFIETQLTDMPVRLTRMEEQLSTVLATQQELLSGQRVSFERMEERISAPPVRGKSGSQLSPTLAAVSMPATAPGGALARLAGRNGQTAAKRGPDPSSGALHAPRPAKMPRPGNQLAPGHAAISTPTDTGRHIVTDERLLVCVAGAEKDDFIPTQSDLLVSLVDSGIDKKLCQLGGSHIRECIAVNGPGEKCRTWRLVMVSSEQKVHFMRRAFLYETPLKALGLVVTDWTWGGRKK